MLKEALLGSLTMLPPITTATRNLAPSTYSNLARLPPITTATRNLATRNLATRAPHLF
jgi:hypothetical protein